MSEMKPEENTPQDSHRLARTRKIQRRKIDAGDLISIAKLTAKGLSESESCRRLEIDPSVWFHFKERGRNDERFSALLEKMKADRIDGLIDGIESIGHGEGMPGGRKDWRALDRVLGFVDSRFRDDTAPPSVTITNTVLVADMEAVSRIYAEPRRVKEDAEVKQLQDAPPPCHTPEDNDIPATPPRLPERGPFASKKLKAGECTASDLLRDCKECGGFEGVG
jgi:hypothetical protein